MLETAIEPMLRARSSLRHELAGLERRVGQLTQDDPVCRRLMSMPGIGAIVALTFRSVVDDPARFASSKKVAPWIGLTPSRNQSCERDVSGGISSNIMGAIDLPCRTRVKLLSALSAEPTAISLLFIATAALTACCGCHAALPSGSIPSLAQVGK